MAAASAGAGIFYLLHIPLPWMLGAMAAAGTLSWHERAAVPPIRPVALLFLGLGLGQTFTPSILSALLQVLPWLLAAAVISIMVGAVLARVFAAMAGTDVPTAYFSAVPGGVVVMAILAQRAGNVSIPAVTLAQTIRIMVVVVTMPPLITWLAPHGHAGAFFAERPPVHLQGLLLLSLAGFGVALVIRLFRLANPWMLGPCGLVITLAGLDMLPSGVPLWLINAAQIAMGAGLGQRLNRRFILASRRLALASVGTTLILSAILAVLAIVLGLVSGLPVTAALLGMAPGGMPEMTITAKVLDLAVPVVLSFHLIRTIACNLLVGPIWKLAGLLKLDR